MIEDAKVGIALERAAGKAKSLASAAAQISGLALLALFGVLQLDLAVAPQEQATNWPKAAAQPARSASHGLLVARSGSGRVHGRVSHSGAVSSADAIRPRAPDERKQHGAFRHSVLKGLANATKTSPALAGTSSSPTLAPA